MLPASQLQLWSASEEGNAAEVKRCLAAGAKVSIRNRAGWNSLHRACMGGDTECVVMQLAAVSAEELTPPCKPEDRLSTLLGSTDEAGNSPLHIAAGCGHVEVVGLLLRAGADPALPKAEKDGGGTPMHAACKALADAKGAPLCARLVDVILALLRGGGLLEAPDSAGRMAVQHLPREWMLRVLARVQAQPGGTASPDEPRAAEAEPAAKAEPAQKINLD